MVCHTHVILIMNNTPDGNDSLLKNVMKQLRGNSVSVGTAASYFDLRAIKLS